MYKFKISSPFRRPLTFRKAILVSLACHWLFVVVLALIVRQFESKNLDTPPLVFDFVFAPTQDYEDVRSDLSDANLSSKASAKQQEIKPSPPKSNDSRPASLSSPSSVASSPTVPTEPLSLQSKFDDSLPEPPDVEAPHEQVYEDPEANEADKIEPLDSRYALTYLKPTALNIEKKEANRSNFLPATVSMTARQAKMLRKRFKKWSENLHRMDLPDSSIVWKHKGRMYEAKVRPIPAETETDIDEVLFEVRTEENGYTLSSEMRMRRLAFSNFAQFVDYWDPRVAVHDDVLVGRFHTNTTFNVSQSYGVAPQFQGRVTTASYEVRSSGTVGFLDEKAVFVGGIETGVKEINLPKLGFAFADDTQVSQSRVQIFDDETWVTFRRDGSFAWQTATSDSSQYRRLPEESFYIIGSKKKKLHVKGVVKGKVLVYSPGKIVIDDDLVYSRHPEISSEADDYLGLVCEKDIEIGHPSVTGAGNLYIHASIYAKGRFRVTHLRSRDEATLHVYGSLTAGSLSATEPRYATHIRFDKRLASRRPPNFPMTDRYEVQEWDSHWQVKPQPPSGISRP